MFSNILRRELLCTHLSKHKMLLTNFYFVHHIKSESMATKIPDTIQIIKPVPETSPSAVLRIKAINKAMKAYLERAKQHNDFLKIKNDEYEIGRHHLANIMGMEAGRMTEDDIDRAIEYLLPSGLYEKKARPMMKHPSKMFPKEKAAQFDNSGRPFSPFFYTKSSNYHLALHGLVAKFKELDTFEDKMIAKGILEPPKEALLNLGGGQWKTMEEVRNMFLENISEQEYAFLVTTLARLGSHPYSFRCKDEIMKYRKEFENITTLEEIPELKRDENGRTYMEATGNRKNTVAQVIVRGEGTGKVRINDTDIFHFKRLQDRETIMYPLDFTNMLGSVDIEVDVTGVGPMAQAGAVRLALSKCLSSFVEPHVVEKMRLAGLLTYDRRKRLRKLPGQKGARAKYTWKKR